MSTPADAYEIDEALVARVDGECAPLGRQLSMVDTKDLRALIADYRLKCELLRRHTRACEADR